VHEWNDPALVAQIGEVRRKDVRLRLLFHDTHHRTIAGSAAPAVYDLRHYDGVLACGRVIRIRYLSEGRARQAWTWHEAADTHVFHPRPANADRATWSGSAIGPTGERADELREAGYSVTSIPQTACMRVRYPGSRRFARSRRWPAESRW
jgi:spore maturation protein CgeB